MRLRKLMSPFLAKDPRIYNASEDKQKHQLCELPTELMDLIASFMDKPALCALRLTCSTLERAAKYQFGRIGLHTLHTDLSKLNLLAMDELAETCGLNQHVKKISIGSATGNTIGYGFIWYRDILENEYLNFLHSSNGFLKLRAVLKKFPNCQSFHISLSNQPESGTWTDCLSPSDAVTLVLHLIPSMARPVESFSCSYPDFNKHSAGVIDPRRFCPHTFHVVRFGLCWSTLTELCLLAQVKDAHLAGFVHELIDQAPNLKKLDLDCGGGEGVDALFQLLGQEGNNMKLEVLQLSGVVGISGQDLQSFLLTNRNSLRILELRTVRFDAGLWETVLESLMREFPVLKELTLLWIADSTTGRYPIHWVHDNVRDVQGRHGRIRITYSGLPVHNALYCLLARYQIQPPQQLSVQEAQ
ncbi:uncharacterized protein BO66DRAFT_475095 [Aspergillus aculeatinus CBS 121060]|uniref:Uncharacterized protein n=1 Tax=Aspergillus aculeatinus CBS 121060 TaxID=1448322 RepID=A0ACD1GVS9_9EURO|nr:hypothetical protein BO66DRAFT_475095 [Aspergillus aculeatinus CBS 121060]RAH65438.1 hypothetical protein BO66DRAFT_475095 [Aspergillus aculeatinus CBS 121060]